MSIETYTVSTRVSSVALTEEQREELREIIDFSQKNIKLRMGLDVRLVCEGMNISRVLPKPDVLFNHICKALDVSVDDVLMRYRKKELVVVRQVVCYIIRRNYASVSLKYIARMLNLDCHTSVIHSCQAAEQRLKFEEAFFVDRYETAVTVFEKLKSKLNEQKNSTEA